MRTQLESQRLLLRIPNESLAEIYLDYLKKNKEFFKPFTPLRSEDYFVLDKQKELFEEKHLLALEDKNFSFLISEKPKPDIIIGDIHLSNIIRGVFQSCYLGYKISEEQNGKGYASEAVHECIRFAFDTIRLHRIEANVMPSNQASIKVLLKSGFKKEGLAKKYLKINGKWEDHSQYAILNDGL